MLKTIGTLFIGTLLMGTSLMAQDKAAKTPAKADTESKPSFAVRKPTQEPVKSRSADEDRIAEKEKASPAMAYQAGTSPFAPTVCRHDDLGKDREFQQCMSYVLDQPGSVRLPMSQFPSNSGE